jgi:glutamate/aspartate transport system substrate-binding protein
VKADSGIKSVTDLKGKTVATTTGTTSVQTLRRNKKAEGMDFKELFGKDHSDSFLLVESGRADAFVMDGSLLAGLIARSKNPKDFKIVGEALSIEPIAIMVRKDDEGLRKIINQTIVEMTKSGEIYKLYDKWFMQPTPPTGAVVNLPMSDNLKEALKHPNDKPMEDYAKKISG